MNKLFGLLLLALAFLAPERVRAGCIIGGGLLCPPVAASYVGPGDVVSGAFIWYGLRAYSLATVGTNIANVCNATDANCADIVSLANGDFDVATAQGSPLNCGGAGGTCTVKTLYDQTGGTECGGAHCNLNTATISARPVLVFNCIGTKPCMDISATIFRSTNSLTAETWPNTISAVANSTNTGAAQSVFATNGGGAVQLNFRNSANNQVGLYGGTNLNASATDGSFHALQAVFNNTTTSDMNVDGTPTAGNSGANSMSGTISIGEISGSQSMTGFVAEAGAWPTNFSGAQSSSMSSNQHSYWGF